MEVGWKNMTKLRFDDKMIKVPSNCEQLKKYKLANTILNVLLYHTGPLLHIIIDVKQLDVHVDSEFDQIICHLSRNNHLQKFGFIGSRKHCYKLPSSFFSLRRLELIGLVNCVFKPPAIFDGFSKLRAVRFVDVDITSITLQRFLSNCPLLRYLSLIDNPSREFVEEKKLTFVELLQCVPLIEFLEIRGVYMENFSAGGMPYKLPTSLVQLRYLCLSLRIDVKDIVSSALCLIRSSPNLKELSLSMYDKSDYNAQISKNFPDIQDYSGFTLDHLKFFMMVGFFNEDLDVDFLKLIMAKSPMLKKAEILLDEAVSPEDEVEILRGLLQLPFRASPSAKLIVKRPEPGFWLKYIESSLSSFFGPDF